MPARRSCSRKNYFASSGLIIDKSSNGHCSFHSYQTHNVALTIPIADFVVSIDLNGVPHEVGTDIAAVLESNPVLAHEADTTQQESDVEKQVVDAVDKEERKLDGKLILAEEIIEGRITWKALKLFLNSLSGDHPLLFAAVMTAGFLATNVLNNFSIWFLGYWGSQYENHHPEEVRVS